MQVDSFVSFSLEAQERGETHVDKCPHVSTLVGKQPVGALA